MRRPPATASSGEDDAEDQRRAIRRGRILERSRRCRRAIRSPRCWRSAIAASGSGMSGVAAGRRARSGRCPARSGRATRSRTTDRRSAAEPPAYASSARRRRCVAAGRGSAGEAHAAVGAVADAGLVLEAALGADVGGTAVGSGRGRRPGGREGGAAGAAELGLFPVFGPAHRAELAHSFGLRALFRWSKDDTLLYRASQFGPTLWRWTMRQLCRAARVLPCSMRS